jgi:hypothetical protein
MLSEQYVANNNHEHDFYDPHDLIFIQSRAITNYSTIEEYAKMMTNGIVFDPIEAVQDAYWNPLAERHGFESELPLARTLRL